ncbi:MAG: DUF3099 domain-containing protein [Propionicimonas sp.]|uniref:DUF3099 domain-containing protein n=1 Tax=Propionicimonas sp. TaxID=1955623 RepID=UPI002B1FA42B|nr:DUF3099 domain-containing protein [Propionicimonas sp.]MEA4942941.1 DUF3099 domain-containing protein [Propionicimonas sp.]MEA5119545.1 DUF3099 domain-containing protein [Propionicimonas sp.]
MRSTDRHHDAPVITTARVSRSLDTNARRTRYLWTMAARVACFLAACFTPLPWNLLLLVAAAVLPAIAVMLANAIDLRANPPQPPAATGDRPALTSPGTLPGSVVDDE